MRPATSKTSVREPAVKWPLIAALSAVSAVALVVAVAWTAAAGCRAPPRAPTERRPRFDAAAVVNETEFDLQSDETQIYTNSISMVPEFLRKKTSFIDLQDLAKYDQEYVKPTKSIITESLHIHDILYGGDQNTLNRENLVKHHSGQYRHKTASVWDPHPQYEFTAFGQLFHLMLVHDSKFVSPDIKVTHIEQNSSWREPPNVKVDGCFYSGNVSSEPGSIVTVSLCGGITGHIRTTTGDYFIEPVETAGDHATPALHAVYRARPLAVREESAGRTLRPSHRPDPQNCGLQEDNEVSNDTDTVIADEYSARVEIQPSTTVNNPHPNRTTLNGESYASAGTPYTPKSRKKRSLSSENVVELMIVADKKMADYHGEELHNYILTLMSIVSKIFRDKSIGNPMHVAVVKLVTSRDLHFVEHRNRLGGIVAADMLHTFCEWQSHHNDDSDLSENHHDSAILLTREHICRSHNQRKCDNTLGLAQLGTMCSKLSSCSIIQDNGLSAAFTIAHELGHVLNMPHDDDAKCKDFEQKDGMNHVMSRMLGNNSHPWTWSTCSRHYLTEYLDAGYGKCLQDDASKDYLEIENLTSEKYFPGENYTENKQCELIYGSGTKICSYMPVCQRLWCTTVPGEKEGCRTQHMPWAEGTQCQNRYNWCQRGKCVPKDRNALKPVDGGWSTWQSFGECTRTCGGGIKKSYRHCTDPPPSNGGKYCIGKRVQVRSCATNECPPGTPDFRDEQCAMFNNNTFNIPDLKTNVQWLPKYGSNGNERCKLFCRVAASTTYYQLKDKVVDGTPCAPDTNDVCVNGVCEMAGCDHVLGSSSRLDLCGVCGGDGSSCRRVAGVHNDRPHQQGYSAVLHIPAGSSNLDIRQRGHNGSSKDDNYLAMVDSATGHYILNGNFVLSTFKKVIVYGGTAIEYSGSDAPVERINSSRPLNKDVTVELLSMGDLYAPDIEYQYTVMRDDRDVFAWALTSEWGACDKICSGEQTRNFICVNKDTGAEAPGSCDDQLAPRPKKQPCNLQCTIKWKILSQSECSASCGAGTRTQNVACVQEYEKRAPTPVPDTMCLHSQKPSNTVPCTGPCLESRWTYTEWTPCSKTCGSGVQSREARCVNDNGETREEIACNGGEKIVSRPCGIETCPQWSVGEWSPCSVTCGEGQIERSVRCRTENGRILNSEHCGVNIMPATKESCSMKPCPVWTTGLWSPCSVTCGSGIRRRMVRCNVPEESSCAQIAKPSEEEKCMFHPCIDEERFENEIFSSNGAREMNILRNKLYAWRTDHWSSCSASCGKGQRRRHVECVNTNTGKSVSFAFCKAKNQPKHLEVCVAPMCVTWHANKWRECSTECGKGYEEREVTCVSSASGETVDETHCVVHKEKPESRRSCESHRNCKPTAIWRTGPWGECSEACGGGVKERKVVCHPFDGARETLDEEMCAELKPRSSIPCNQQSCKKQTTVWNSGEWSKCNATCGRGHQHRQVQCQDSEGASLPAGRCSGGPAERPVAVQPCRAAAPCPRQQPAAVGAYRWKASPAWSPCSTTCGPGVQNRWVSCRHYEDSWRHALPADDARCLSAAGRPPASRRPCVRQRACEDAAAPGGFGWLPDAWRECSHGCGKKGRQTRRVYCFDRAAARKVNRRHCDRSTRPPRKRKCNQSRCAGLASCADVLQKRAPQPQRLSAAPDGEYVLNLHGRNVSVYCHGMRTGRPAEYLTLAKDNENYSEIYEQRLKDPSTCPFYGERRQNCPCDNVPIPSSGFTIFEKIRLDITSLKVDSKDFTFSKQIRGKPVPFGEAGDCYSNSKSGCPQGRFSIDLTGTGMRVSKGTTWVGKGPNTSFWVNTIEDNTKIAGRCGGYCGTCVPDKGLTLDVLTP